MKFQGIIPALLTPFDNDDEVDCDAIDRLVNRLIEEGVGGLFACGATGEWWALTQDERMRIVDQVVESADDRTKVIVHVGSTSTRFSVELARHAQQAGAAAVSALPPVGSSYSAESVWEYFKAIGASTDLPLYLYHFPRVYGDSITVDRFVDAIDTIPTLGGVKFSSYNIDDLIELKLRANGRLNILSGAAEQLLSGMACGADGSICTWYNLFPRLANKIIECVENGDLESARKYEDLIVRFARLCRSHYLGNLKWLIGLRGIGVGKPREPMPNPTPDECKERLPQIEATGIFDWCI